MAGRTKKPARIQYPEDYNPIREYWLKMESGEEVVSRKIYKAFRKLNYDLDHPDEYYYSNKRANHVLEFAENYCRQSKGKYGGQLVKLELWEKAILAAIFGFVDINGIRKYREVILIVAKKNGKSLLSSIVGLYLMVADGEPGPEVYAVAPLSLDTEIMTINTLKTMKTIEIGDYVFTPEGYPTKVNYISPIIERDTYKITFDDGVEIISTGNHPWEVEQLSSGGHNKSLVWKVKTIETKDIRVRYDGRHATRIKIANAYICDEKELSINPYTLGAWLGDGKSNRGCLCGHVDDIEIRNAIKADGYDISYMKQQNNTVYFTVLGLRTLLRENDLLDNKHIPEEYFYASKRQRLELLQGLMDTDGTCSKCGECRYCGNNKALVSGVHRLALSLGFKAHMRQSKDQNGKDIYIVSFKEYSEHGTVFKLTRKSKRLRKHINAKNLYRYVEKIEKIPNTPCRCISVEDSNHLFVVGKELITTHNTKKDQAKIVWGEAKRMVKKSATLLKRIKPLVAEMASEFNDGVFKPLASDSDTLDGLNVHGALMDEIHQWKQGKALFDIIADGVTAREQPLIFMTSTAGVIREDIYDEKYDYATNVINGYEDDNGYKDEHFLAFIYELDSRKEWTDEKCWKKANPGLGTIKNLQTLREKVRKALANPHMVKNLVCKEFNIRETSGEAWLTFEQLNNTAIFDLKELKPRYGIGGADLSSTTDLTAAKVIFMVPQDPHIYVLSMYWLAEDLVEQRVKEDKIPYDLWIEQGYVRTCPGNKVHAKYVTQWFIEVQEQMDIYIPYIGYDDWGTQYWVEEMRGYFGQESMVKVIQGKKTLSTPMKQLGADLESKLIVYNNNPVDKWCLANTSYDEDRNGNIQPQKTSKRTRRIDGTAALLDAYVVLQDRMDEYQSII